MIKTQDISLDQATKKEEDKYLKNNVGESCNNLLDLNQFTFPFKKYNLHQLNQNTEPIYTNEHFSLYKGIINTKEECSYIILNNIDKNIKQFHQLLTQLNIAYVSISKHNLLNHFINIYGYIITSNIFIIICEPVSVSLEKVLSLKQQTLTSLTKQIILIKLMEILLKISKTDIILYDITPSNIFICKKGSYDIKLFIPLNGLYLFKEKESEFPFCRYSPPEIISEKPIFQNINNIWMLGCFMLEMFSQSKVWECMLPNEIIKNLKGLIIPKIPKNIPRSICAIICDCLNPFYKTRTQIKEILLKYYNELQKEKSNDSDLVTLIQYIEEILNLKTNVSMSKRNNNSTNNFNEQEKNVSNQYCTICYELVCDKSLPNITNKNKHSSHIDKIKPTLTILNESQSHINNFKSKFDSFLTNISQSFPIDSSIHQYISEQRKIIQIIYQNHLQFINEKFALMKNTIKNIKQIELSFLNKYNAFFNSTLSSFENTINSISQEQISIKQLINHNLSQLNSFSQLSPSNKQCFLKNLINIQSNLKQNKNSILSKYNLYRKQLIQCDKTKKYFQYITHKRKESKIYKQIEMLLTYKNDLNNYYNNFNISKSISTLSTELDNCALVNSRNYLTKNDSIFHIAIFNSSKILSFDISANSLHTSELKIENNFYAHSRNINVNGILYVNGGFINETKSSSKSNLILKPSTTSSQKILFELNKGKEMIYGHSSHSLLFIPQDHIVVVSGKNTKKCERYSICDDKWYEIVEVNYVRQDGTLFYYNEEYIYLFGGVYYDNTKEEFNYINNIERLNINFGYCHEGSKWEVVPYDINNPNLLNKSIMAVIPLNINKILLVGGMDKNMNLSNDVILFDFESNECTLCEDVLLPKRTCFPTKSFLFYSDMAYQFDNQGIIYEFNIKECTFKLINI